MPAFETLPPRPLLRQWAYYDGPLPYTYLSKFLNKLGYTKTTRRHPLGRAITASDVRRFVHHHLKDQPEFPEGRAPNADDYDRLRATIKEQMDMEELA